MNLLWSLHVVSLTGRQSPRLDRLTVDIPVGTTAVLGQSGAGKTSLLNLLVGFERPTSGQIQFQASELRRFWSPPTQGLWPHLSVAEHLSTVAPGDKQSNGQFDQLLADFNLLAVRDARPASLSLGERSRLSVARCLASGAQVLIMDEPLAHVDAARLGSYWSAIRAHCQANGTALVFATHSPDVVLREATQVICLSHGKLCYAGSVHELYDQPQSPELAEMLGPCNWLSVEDQQRWLSTSSAPTDCCIRPERLAVSVDLASAVEVAGSRFAGSCAELDVVHLSDGARRTFIHRPARASLRPGDRVMLKVLLLLMALLLPGCGDSEPALTVKKESYWSMPPDGPRVPAPRGMTVSPEGEYLVLDNAGRLLVFDETGKLQRKWWMPAYSVGKPEGVCVLKDGRIAVADTHYHRVVLFNHEGEVSSTFGKLGSGPGEFYYPVSVIQDDKENLYVCEYGDGNDRVQKFSKDGTFLLQIGSYGTDDGQFQRPSGAAWYEGRIYVVDAFNNRIQVFDEGGKLVAILGTSDKISDLYYPYDICVNEAGELYVVEYGAGRVSKFDRSGKLLGRYGHTGGGSEAAELKTPWGLTVDHRGRVYVCDTGNRRIVELEL
ncbi:MAG: ATP-binding cassette domain-containing protein [Planctomycetes bacterium]|nr:ATP-binding cassette domain-containing protein [Planctomycetota bacterium]